MQRRAEMCMESLKKVRWKETYEKLKMFTIFALRYQNVCASTWKASHTVLSCCILLIQATCTILQVIFICWWYSDLAKLSYVANDLQIIPK